MNRADHLAWCKHRALAYCDAGNVQDAFASMASDLLKHDETCDHTGIKLGMIQLVTGMLDTPEQMRHFLEGFK